jgi:glycosyltransferase involved in cell wall biosynthesis
MTGGIEVSAIRGVTKIAEEIPYKIIFFDKVNANLRNEIPDVARSNIIVVEGKCLLSRIVKLLLFIYSNQDSIYIFSTWRSIFVGMLSKRFLTKRNTVTFYHRSSPAHFMDALMRKYAVKNSQFIMADCFETLRSVPSSVQCEKSVVRPIFNFEDSAHRGFVPTPPIKVCFVGRLSKVKNLPAIAMFMKCITEMREDIVLDIFGADQGQMQVMASLSSKYDIRNRVTFKGEISPFEVGEIYSNSHFIISLSHTEGLAMNLVEAMTAGVIPICGRKGGPNEYCVDGVNAIVLDDYSDSSIQTACIRTIEVFEDKHIYRKMSESAKKTFVEEDFYEKNFINFIKERYGTN